MPALGKASQNAIHAVFDLAQVGRATPLPLRSWTDGPETFKGMVEVSRALMRGRSAAQQRDAVIQGFPQVEAPTKKSQCTSFVAFSPPGRLPVRFHLCEG